MTDTTEQRPEPLVPVEAITIVWTGVDHPEGLAVDVDGTIWCGGEEGQIYRGTLDGTPEQIALLPGRTLGFALDADGNAYCADMTGPGIYRIDRDGAVSTVSTGTADKPTRLPNHPAFLPSGQLVYTDSGEWGASDGCLFAVQPGGETTLVDTTACRFPNGLAVAPDGRALAVVESTLPGVSLLELEADGSLGERRVLIELPGTIPDGVAYDDAGRLLVSCWAPDAVFLVGAGCEPVLLVHDPQRFSLNQPTNIAFVPGTSTVIAANIGERFLSVFEHDTAGADLPRPRFPSTPPLADAGDQEEPA
jgi:gluconolactonase